MHLGPEQARYERELFMYNVTAIVPRGQGIGFKLAGIEIREVANITEAHKILANEIDDDHNGIILVDETFTLDLSSKLQKQVDESTIPLVVNIPIISKWEYIYDRDEVFENIIHRAIGYRIKFSGD